MYILCILLYVLELKDLSANKGGWEMNVLLQSIATKIFSTVCFHMSPQTACPRRGKVTLVALVWLFSTVKKRWEILLQNIAPQFSCFACLYNITQHLDFLRKLNTSNQKDIMSHCIEVWKYNFPQIHFQVFSLLNNFHKRIVFRLLLLLLVNFVSRKPFHDILLDP